MGACCSCHRIDRFDGYVVDHEVIRHREVDDDDLMVRRGDHGARVRLQGSSRFVSTYIQQGKKGHNQDAMTVWENYMGEKDMFFCGVFDGHGPSGHNVARYVRDILPSKLSTMNQDNDSDSSFESLWKSRILKSFKEMDEELENETTVESYSSGTTTVALLKQREHLVIANLGDSRAVLCKRGDQDELVADQLTVDLKPNLPNEAERIRSCQGRVMAMESEPSVYRVWMPDEDTPGLAMARAFGDFCLKDYGVISTPDVFYRKLTDKDEFVVLASDGIWDVLSNEDVIRIVASARKRSTAARLLVDIAVRVWKYKYPRAKIDDCAVVILFLKRQRPLLTKSMSEVTELSLNYPALGSNDIEPSEKCDDGLDTVLNLDVTDKPEDDVAVATGTTPPPIELLPDSGDGSHDGIRNRRHSSRSYSEKIEE